MKYRLFLLTIITVLVIAACTPNVSSVAEPAAEVIEIEVEETALEEIEPVQDSPSMESDIGEVSFSQDVWPILEKYALAVHGGHGGVFLESYTGILNYVEPGNPLPDELIQIIHDWIEQGAKEN